MNGADNTVEIIREAFRYTQSFRDKTFVFQLDDTIVNDSLLPAVVRDMVLLQQNGIRVVLVAGARTRIEEVLERYGVRTERCTGIRISSVEAIPFIKMAAFDVANRIMTSLSAFGVNAVIGNWVRARSVGVVDGVDYQDAGVVDRVRADLLSGVIDQGSIPILPCIGWSAAGKPYNVSSRELGARLAVSLQASKLFFVTSFDGLVTRQYGIDESISAEPSGRISRLSVDQADRFLELNRGPEDTGVELVRLGLEAARGGVERVHLVDGRADGSVLTEIFSNLGVGSMIHTNEYQSIRDMRREDVPDVYRLMRPMIEKKLLIPRDEVDLSDVYGDYVVFETDGMVHGCGALHVYPPAPTGDTQAEVAGLAVDPSFDQAGIGKRIVSYLLERAKANGIKRVFALTTQASDWFEQLGFRPGNVAEVPGQKQSAYDHARRSRIVVRDL